MSRIEPRIETFEISASSGADAMGPRRATSRRGDILQWVQLSFIALFLLAIALGLAHLALGFDPFAVSLSVWGRALVMGGLVVAYLAQLLSAIALFRTSFSDGLLALIVPGFFVVPLRRQGHYNWFIGIFALGLLCLALGTILLS
jgi:hypothetical protein